MYSENLKKIRNAKNLSVEKLSKIIDVPASTLWGYEGNKRIPSIDLPIQLNRKLDVNANWFLTGDGMMFLNKCENTHAFLQNEKPSLNIKEWGKRLAKLLADNNETPLNFSKRTLISESRIERFILYSDEPTIQELTKIKCNVDISVDELLYGETIESNTEPEKVSLSVDEILKLKQILKDY